jgi:hypothetical protein
MKQQPSCICSAAKQQAPNQRLHLILEAGHCEKKSAVHAGGRRKQMLLAKTGTAEEGNSVCDSEVQMLNKASSEAQVWTN